MELGGDWQAAVADDELRRRFGEPDFDDSGFEVVAVPGHWRSQPAFADSDGPLLYRRRFEARPNPDKLADEAPVRAGTSSASLELLPEGARAWLVFDGLFYQGDVWFDGDYLGDTEGYFVRHSFEITDALAARTEHVVAVEVTCSPQTDRTAKRNITGVFQHWDCLPPDYNPGGIWRPVRVEHTGPVRARSLRVVCTEADETRAVVSLRAELDTDVGRNVTIATTLGGHDDEAVHPLAAGSNFVEWTITIPRPELWWPHALGEAVLHELSVEVKADGQLSHRLTRRIGLRSLAWKNWTLSVNGERLFLKGTNQGPTTMSLGEAPPEALAADVLAVREAGLDLMRVHAHISRPETYDAADEAGVLLWQDFPLQWGYARSIRKQAARQAAAAVDLLGHHPSVAIWCGHNEPFALDLEPGARRTRGEMTKLLARFAAGQQLPTWNKTILDRTVKRALRKADPSRPVIPHSGVLPHVGSGGTDTHVYFGWYHGEERDFPGFCKAVPRLARFVSEFGAQAVPETADFMEPERWPDLDWARLEREHSLQKFAFRRYVPPRDHATFESWRDATQNYQAEVIKHHVETLRRLKYRPTGGFCQFAFADGAPGVTWSVLDQERVPKAGYHALVAACRPVIVAADRLPAAVVAGDELEIDVHVVSDLRTPIEGATVTSRLTWTGGHHEWAWTGDIPADECVRVGRVEAVVPGVPGPLVLDLTLDGPNRKAKTTNHYETVIVAPHNSASPVGGL